MRKLVTRALEGDVAAMKEISDRLDGKPSQGVDLGVEVQVTRIERAIVEPGQTLPERAPSTPSALG